MSYNFTYHKTYYQFHKDKINENKRARTVAKKVPKILIDFICVDCGKQTQGYTRNTKYCGNVNEKYSCAYKRKRDSSKKWLKAHPKYNYEQFRNYQLKKKGNLGRFTQKEWEYLKKIYNYTCCKCLRSEPQICLTQDHKIPISKNGSNTIDNIQPLCRSCNSQKGINIWFPACSVDKRLLTVIPGLLY